MTGWFLNNFVHASRCIYAAHTDTISAVHQTKTAVYIEARVAARVKTDRSSNQSAVLPAQQNKRALNLYLKYNFNFNPYICATQCRRPYS